MKEEKFPNTKKSSHQQVCVEFWNLRGLTRRGKTKQNKQTNKTKQNKTKKKQNMHLNTTPSGEVAQMLVATSREWGMNMEVWVECLG